MSQLLEYNYAVINVNTGFCGACITTSTKTIHPSYIEIPYTSSDYAGKYYNLNGDQMWYWDAEFTQPWEEAPQW